MLGGLPVRRLWGIGPVAEEKLNRLGIETIGQLAALTDAEAANILGATIGPALHRLARGIDDRPVAERAEAKQISSESTFAVDLTSLEQLREAIDPIAEHAHQRLLRDGRGARTVTVKLKKSDMSTLTRSATLPYATTDAGALVAVARRLLLDPREIGPDSPTRRWVFGVERRAAGVAVPGLGPVGCGVGRPALRRTATDAMFAPAREAAAGWRVGDDVAHRDSGTAGYRAPATVWSPCGSRPAARARARRGRFPPIPATSTGANPVDSLDWPDYVGALRANAPSAPRRSMTSRDA